MEFIDFKTKFVDQLIGEDEAKITSDTEFRRLSSWDSLTAMAVIAMVEDEYKIKISDEELKNMRKIGDIYNFVIAGK